MRPRPSGVLLPAALLLLGVLPACSAGGPDAAVASASATGMIRVASYDFSENQILAEVYAQGIRRAGLPVQVQHGVGPREVVEPALEQGVLDVVVDYLGTAVSFARPDTSGEEGTSEQLHARLGSALGPRGVTVLDAAAAEDKNGFAVTTAFAAAHGVSRLSDLAALAPELTFGGPPECSQRPFCLPGLRDRYGLRFGSLRTMPSRAATVEALVSGEIDVGMLETTDARLGGAPVMLLADDRALQPHENVVPLVRSAVLQRQGDQLRRALDSVSARLTTDQLIRLNHAVEIDGLTPAVAASRWWAG